MTIDGTSRARYELSRATRALIVAACLIVATAITVADAFAPQGAVFSAFYVFAVFVAAWYVGRAAGAVVGAYAVAAATVFHAFIDVDWTASIAVWNVALRSLLVAMTVVVAARMREAHDLLVDRSIRDPLTGLLNRRGLMELASIEHAQATRSKCSIAAISLDVDGLKRINDRHGHKAGDDLLRNVADCLVDATRATDLVARIGGDEFLVFMIADHDDAEGAAQRIKRALVDGPMITASVGLAVAPAAETDLTALIESSDTSMYRARRVRRPSASPADIRDG